LDLFIELATRARRFFFLPAGERSVPASWNVAGDAESLMIRSTSHQLQFTSTCCACPSSAGFEGYDGWLDMCLIELNMALDPASN
jgi:hypothetical protein